MIQPQLDGGGYDGRDINVGLLPQLFTAS